MPLGSGRASEYGSQDYLGFGNDQFGTAPDGMITPSGFIDGSSTFMLPSPTHAGLLPFSARGFFPKMPRENEGQDEMPDANDA